MLRWIVALLFLSCACTSKRAPTRAEVFKSLVTHVAVPDARGLADAQRALTAHLADLERAPSESALCAARASWRDAALAWVRVESLSVLATDVGRNVLRAAFWPPRTARLEELLQSEDPLHAQQIEALGVDVRGMYALEWLLFAGQAERMLAASAEGSRTRALAHALASDVQLHALDLTRAVGTGELWVAILTRDEHASLSRLVNLTTNELEQLVTDRLRPAVARRTRTPLRATEIRGGVSGTSSELVAEQLAVLERVYLGSETRPGLSALLAAAAPAIEQHLRALFKIARERVAALDRSLEQLAQLDQPRIVAAQGALRELERALKTEVVSALGITLTFESSDAD